MRNINSNAPAKCNLTITINASREKVWTVLTDINNWANWQTNIANPQLIGELKPNATFIWKSGGAKIHSTLHTVEPFKHIGWTGKSFGTLGIHNWTLTEKQGKTEVAIDESMEGLLVMLFKKSFNRILNKGNQDWLDMLKKECEK